MYQTRCKLFLWYADMHILSYMHFLIFCIVSLYNLYKKNKNIHIYVTMQLVNMYIYTYIYIHIYIKFNL